MIRALIVDDEPPARRRLRSLIEAHCGMEVAGEASTGAEALRLLAQADFDLVFLDIQMPGLTGFDVLEKSAGHRFAVVFVTAHDDYALRAYEAEAFDYVLKPVDPVRFERVLARAKEQIELRQNTDLSSRLERVLQRVADPSRYLARLQIQDGDRTFFVPVETLDWLESARNYVCVHVNGATHVMRSTLDEIARQLDPDRFLRINRSQLVNLDRVREMRRWFHGEQIVIMQDGTELRWSRRFRSQSSRA